MADYHRGEIVVQEQSCLREEASRVSRIIRGDMPEAAARFLEQQVMLILGLRDDNGLVWAYVIYGEPGFVQAADAHTVSVSSLPSESDPLWADIKSGRMIGMLAIEFATRRRMRVNGRITQVHANGFHVRTREVYSNCPKYIQPRTFTGFKPMTAMAPRLSTRLDQAQMDTIRRSDTFFIATHHSESGADASHRGGLPGFVHIVDQRTLAIPDYRGNAMFNTLGNIAENPQTGLLFLDYEEGNLLQINGDTTIQWEGSERSILFRVRTIRSVIGGFPLGWAQA